MKARRLVTGSIAAALALAILPARAGDFHLVYAGVESTPLGENLKGTLRIELRNVSDAEARNVRLSLAHPGGDAIGPAALQFGAIPAGQARTAVSDFIFSGAADSPLVWRVQYEQGGMTREVRLLGEGPGGPQ